MTSPSEIDALTVFFDNRIKELNHQILIAKSQLDNLLDIRDEVMTRLTKP